MGANPNIFINKENRRVVPPEEENFFVSAEEFKAIDTAFATKADQSALDSLSGSVSGLSSLVSAIDGEVTTLQTDLGTAETDITNLQSSKEDTANKTDSFATINTTLFPNWKGVQDYVNEEVPQQDPYNFATASNVTYIQNEYGRRVSSSVSFDRSAIYASEFDTDTKRVIAPVYTDLAITKTGAFHKNKADVFHSSETVPTVISSPASWLIVTGDSYLTGFENLNYIEMEYHERIKISSTYYEDVVVCNITAIADGNTDLSPYLLMDLNFNENVSPVEATSVLNNSTFYGDVLIPTVYNPANGASYEDLGSLNYALERINASENFSTRPYLEIDFGGLTENYDLLTESMTLVIRTKLISQGTDAERGIISNRDSANRGFNLARLTSGEIQFGIGTIDNTSRTTRTSTGANLTLDLWVCIALRVSVVSTALTVEVWIKSFDDERDITKVTDSSTSPGVRSLRNAQNITLDGNSVNSTTGKNKSDDWLKVWNTLLSDSQIEAEMIAMDGPNNAP